MNLHDLLNVESAQRHLKMFFNQASEETLARGNDLDVQVLENLHERQVRKSTPMTNAMTLYRKDFVLRKEPRSYQRLRTMVNDIPEQQQQNMLISQQERSRDRAAAACASTGYEEKRKDCRALTFKGSCSKGGNVLSKMTGQRNSINKSG